MRALLLLALVAACGPKGIDRSPRPCAESIDARARGDYVGMNPRGNQAYALHDRYARSCKQLCDGGDQAACLEHALLEADGNPDLAGHPGMLSLQPYCDRGEARACEWIERRRPFDEPYDQSQYDPSNDPEADQPAEPSTPFGEYLHYIGNKAESEGFGFYTSKELQLDGGAVSFDVYEDPASSYIYIVVADGVSFQASISDDTETTPFSPAPNAPSGIYAQWVESKGDGQATIDLSYVSGSGRAVFQQYQRGY